MKILGALGFGIFLLILSVLMPRVFTELSKTFIVFLQSSQQIIETITTIATKVSIGL